MEVAYYRVKYILEATPENICVPYAAQYKYYDEPTRLPAKEEIPSVCIPRHCSFLELGQSCHTIGSREDRTWDICSREQSALNSLSTLFPLVIPGKQMLILFEVLLVPERFSPRQLLDCISNLLHVALRHHLAVAQQIRDAELHGQLREIAVDGIVGQTPLLSSSAQPFQARLDHLRSKIVFRIFWRTGVRSPPDPNHRLYRWLLLIESLLIQPKQTPCFPQGTLMIS